MKFEIKNRWTGAVQYSCELSAEMAGKSYAMQLGFSVKQAVAAGANLAGADLARADLADAYLAPVRDDIYAVLSAAPGEAIAVRDAIASGRVDGSVYQGGCACLVGTIANARGVSYEELGDLRPSSSRPAERFFMAIRRGDTPETNAASKLAHGWVSEWIDRMQAAFAVQA